MTSIPSVSWHALALVPPFLALADLYVDVNANCAVSDGTPQAPYCSISEAITAASSGDQIRIAPGVYNERLTVDKNLSLLGEGGRELTILDAELLGTAVVVTANRTVTI